MAREGGKRRRISERERRLFAPMADVGEMVYDEDAVYINIKDHLVCFSYLRTPEYVIRKVECWVTIRLSM
jgi:hypothetical protein